MRKTFFLICSLAFVLAFAGCGGSSAQPAASNNTQLSALTTEAKPKILIAYFSHSGNTRLVANQIHAQVGGDMFEIKTIKQYNKDFETTIDEARAELNAKARPELIAKVENMQDYDTIFLGFPNWVGTMPMVMFTFLEQYDFAGKTIVPFCTHGTSGLSNTVTDLRNLVPQATVQEALSIYRNQMKDSNNIAINWLHKLGYIN